MRNRAGPQAKGGVRAVCFQAVRSRTCLGVCVRVCECVRQEGRGGRQRVCGGTAHPVFALGEEFGPHFPRLAGGKGRGGPGSSSRQAAPLGLRLRTRLGSRTRPLSGGKAALRVTPGPEAMLQRRTGRVAEASCLEHEVGWK